MDQQPQPDEKPEALAPPLEPPKDETATGRESPSPKKQERQQDDDDDDLDDDDKTDQPQSRQDLFVCFTNDKDLRHHETISIKAALYKGIAIKVKILNHIWIENILFSIESAPDLGIINLRFEECRLLKKAVQRLIEFCKSTNIIESLGLFKTTFDDGQDFKRLVEAVSFNNKIKQFSVQSSDFDEDYHGKTISRCILESRSLKELDLSYVTFEDPKSFYEMANGLLNERCRLGALKLRGISFGQLEGKVMQFILMRNKSLQTLDISQCSTDSPENLENVFCKFDSFCNLRTLIAENLNADFNYVVEIFGEAIGGNTKMEGLSIKENKLKQTQYCNFWELMQENRSLKKMNVSKTEITDKVCAKISLYLQQPELKLQDLNLSRNSIAADGLVSLAEALKVNTSLTTLNISQNLIREGGILEFVEALKVNKTVSELCLSFNKINNAGMSALAGFLEENNSIKVLDISRNIFADSGFCDFARQLAVNKGIESLNLSKNKDVTDEVGLKELAEALAYNSSLAVIDLSGLKVRKPCVLQYFQPALKSNITLKRIIGKIPPGIIGEDLKDNVTIEADIKSKYRTIKKEQRRELRKLPLHRIEGDQTQLLLRDQPNELLTPALKFIRYRKIHAVDLSNMQLEDESLRLLALYLEENPLLRSLALAENLFTDDGLAQIIVALKKNTNLNHLNIMSCNNISDQSLRALEDMVTKVNMSLYSIEMDLEKFDPDLIDNILDQAAMNRAIQEHLKPQKVQTSDNNLAEIQFQKGANIAKYFDSAIKAWRIMCPSFIRVVNEGLEDEHVEKLCTFLSNKNLIQSLNLRRNKIGDKGALAIAEYIRKADKTLTSLELERNLIQDDGGEALLKAMQANMRMECCKMAYGNPLRQKICRQIEREIKANLQIKQTVLPRYKSNNNSLTSYEESDRGPDFVRCALKSCELFKILHLSLPDNMIGEKEMMDIAYVISRNTPLRTLNLSDNAVDAKSAVILADALGNNNHLQELDLRTNQLKDAGIAVLMEPFISQIIIKNQMAEDSKVKAPSRPPPEEGAEPLPEQTAVVKKEYRKLKMKLERIHLDNNLQTTEALKHIYTVLIGNPDIEITIDLPEIENHEVKDGSSQDENDSEGLLSPKNAVVPYGGEVLLQQEGSDFDEDQDELSPKNDMNLDSENATENTKEDKQVIPAICRPNCCKKCRMIFYPFKGVLPKSFTEVFFPGFFQAKIQATQFKISWSYVQDSEQKSQKSIFASLVCVYISYFIFAIIVPFLFAPNVGSECQSMLPLTVYAGYGGFLIISLVIEMVTYFNVKSSLKLEEGGSMLSCNSYLMAKQLQGQLGNLDTYAHICYVVSMIRCTFAKDPEPIDFTSVDDAHFDAVESTNMHGIWSVLLAIASLTTLVFSNLRRVKLIWEYRAPHPEIHKIMPNTYRNIQLAWICNLYTIAIILESTSLSEYLIDYGSNIVPGKDKNPLGVRYEVFSISDALVEEKMKYQDLPMICIFIVGFLINMLSGGAFDLILVCFIGVTGLSMFFNYITIKTKRDQKNVDQNVVITLIKNRMEAAEAMREQMEDPVDEEKKDDKVNKTGDNSARETDKSESSDKLDQNGDFDFTKAADQTSKKLLLKNQEDKLNISGDDKINLQGSIDSNVDLGTKSMPPPIDQEVKGVDLDVSISKIT